MSAEDAVHMNGSAIDPLDRIIAELEEELAPISAERGQLEAQIAELLKREHRIKSGVSALRQDGAPRRPAAAPQAPKGTGRGRDWVPGQEAIDRVHAAVANGEGKLTVTEIAEAAGLSRDTARRALDVLRSEQKVRLAGTRSSQGSPKVYAVMPS